ncbi:MAG: ATP-binding protein [Candidatus Omnitrophica bacterium]|nr:ATP-binding protein [Candidatus Omnitrophota bacterium]
MAVFSPQNESIKLLSHLVTTLRQISIYPPKHPLIVNSMKSVSVSLAAILSEKEQVDITVSPDGKITVNQETLQEKGGGIVSDFTPYFKKLEVENLTFSRGVTDQEIEAFVKIFLIDKEQLKAKGDLNGLFAAQGISHIKARQFEYLKVEKGTEATVVEGKAEDIEKLKEKLKDFTKDKLEKPEDAEVIQNQIFDLVRDEFKQHNKLSSPIKAMLKKFLLHSKEQDAAIAKLKAALLDIGCPPEQVDALINKINEEISKPSEPKVRVSAADVEALRKENEDLKEKLNSLRQEMGRHASAVDELKKENRRVLSEKQRIDNIVHNMAEGMVVVDAEGRIILVNPAGEALLGITKDDIGKPIKEVVKDEHLLTLTRQIAADKDGVVEKDIELVTTDESTKKVVRTSSAVVEDNNGNTVGMVTMLNDITKQKEIEGLKNQFMASVSHELRTPLVAIEKSIGLILGKSTGEISETQSQFLSIADRNLKRLTILINDLLDLSKLEAHKMLLKREPVMLDKLITESIESMTNWATTKSVALQKSVASDLPIIEIDPNRMIQVLNNLISNAIKYTPVNGSITVEAAFVPDQKLVRVSVRDTGVGIPKDDLGKVFEKFYQVNGGTGNTEIKGTGIGLAIVREIVELHQGKVWVESEQGKGASFIFTVPLEIKTEESDGTAD